MNSDLQNRDEKASISQQQYIIFSSAGQDFAVDIMQTREIVDLSSLTKMPDAPEFVSGVVNLRGNIIPVIDLNKRLGGYQRENNIEEYKVIIVAIQNQLLGLQVKNVKGIEKINKSEIVEAPEITQKINHSLMEGVGKLEDKIILIIDLSGILSTREVKKLKDHHN